MSLSISPDSTINAGLASSFGGTVAAGANGPVQIWISRKGEAPASPTVGEATLRPAQAKMLMAGELYVNIHTKDHPAGEMRGQVILPSVR